jgi:hypothetical protein
MKNRCYSAFLCALTAGAFALVGTHQAVAAPASFTGSYSQNFDSLGTTGTTLSSIPEWSVYSLSGSHDTFSYASTGLVTSTFLPWSTSTALNVGSGSSTLSSSTTLTVDTFTSATQAGVRAAGGFNFGSSVSPFTSSDRALGSSPTGTAGTELQLALTNTTGAEIDAINLAYDIRRFTVSTNNNGTSASDPYTGEEELPGYSVYYSLNNGTSWTNVASLTPADLNGAAGTPSGGPSVPNTVGVTNVPSTAIALASAWSAGSTLDIRWFDDNAESPSPDQNIALDNVVVTTAVPEPASLALLGLGAAALVGRRRVRNV